MARPTRRWKDVVADEPVNETRAKLYERLMDAEEQIAHARYRAGVGNDVVQTALDSVDERMSDAERCEDLYLSALTYYVEALGGRVEVQAIFDDDTTVVIRRAPLHRPGG